MNKECTKKNKLYYITVDDGDAITNGDSDVLYYTSVENALSQIEEFVEANGLKIYSRSERVVKAINPDTDSTIKFDIGGEIDIDSVLNASYDVWDNIEIY